LGWVFFGEKFGVVGGLILLGFVVVDVVILWCGCGFLCGKGGQEDGCFLVQILLPEADPRG
jgi:hypothetical protein